MSMTTNFYLIVKNALAWMDAHPNSTLSFASTPEGGFIATATATSNNITTTETWSLTTTEVQKSFATDDGLDVETFVTTYNTQLPQQPPLTLGEQISGYFSSTYNLEALSLVVQDPNNELTSAIMLRAADDQEKLDNNQSIDPWPDITPRVIPSVPWPYPIVDPNQNNNNNNP